MIAEILKQLEAEKEKIDAAIAALGNGSRPKIRRGYGKRKMSDEARAKIGAAQRKRWKAQKAQAKA